MLVYCKLYVHHFYKHTCVCVAYMDIYHTHYIYVFSDISDFSMLSGSLRSFLGRMCPVSRLH